MRRENEKWRSAKRDTMKNWQYYLPPPSPLHLEGIMKKNERGGGEAIKEEVSLEGPEIIAKHKLQALANIIDEEKNEISISIREPLSSRRSHN